MPTIVMPATIVLPTIFAPAPTDCIIMMPAAIVLPTNSHLVHTRLKSAPTTPT